LLESLKITGRVRPLQVIHRFQALLDATDPVLDPPLLLTLRHDR